jgi:cytochrome c551/c552
MSSSARSIVPTLCAMTFLALTVGCAARDDAASAGSDTAGSSTPAIDTTTDRVALHPFTGDTTAANAGRLVFLQHNCYGCHGGLAGGGMGPSLRDTVWKYGGTDSLIFRSIHDGRPMGMPTWGGQLTTRQIDNLVAYIRSMRTPAEPRFFFWTQSPG